MYVWLTLIQISVDFAQNGVDVTMLQRTPTFVMSVDKGQAVMGQSSIYEDHRERVADVSSVWSLQ